MTGPAPPPPPALPASTDGAEGPVPACIASPHLRRETRPPPPPTTAGRGGGRGRGCGAQTPRVSSLSCWPPALGSRVRSHCGLPTSHQVPGPALSTLQTLVFNYRDVPMQRDQCSPCGSVCAQPPQSPCSCALLDKLCALRLPRTCRTRGQACSRFVRWGWDPVPGTALPQGSKSHFPRSGGCPEPGAGRMQGGAWPWRQM